MERKDRKVNNSARDCRLSVTGRESSASEAGESCCHGDGPAKEGLREQAARQSWFLNEHITKQLKHKRGFHPEVEPGGKILIGTP